MVEISISPVTVVPNPDGRRLPRRSSMVLIGESARTPKVNRKGRSRATTRRFSCAWPSNRPVPFIA